MKRVIITGLIVLLLTVILDVLFVIGDAHSEVPWSRIPGFFSLYGFFGCLLLIFGAKLLGHFLQRKEDYYNRHDDE